MAEYGDTLAVIGASGDPVSYTNPNFSIDSDAEALIDDVVPYKLTVKFADYQGADADIYESESTITYQSPCPLVGDTSLSYTAFTAITGTLATNAYTGTAVTFDVSTLFSVTPAFCADEIIYSCASVTGPDGSSGVATFTGTDYPATQCPDSFTANMLSVQAGPTNYV